MPSIDDGLIARKSLSGEVGAENDINDPNNWTDLSITIRMAGTCIRITLLLRVDNTDELRFDRDHKYIRVVTTTTTLLTVETLFMIRDISNDY